MTRTAVITLAHGRHEHLMNQHRALLRSTLAPDHYLVVAIDDPSLERWRPSGALRPQVIAVPSSDLGLPLSTARNTGAESAAALGADLLIFLDVDCLPGPGLVASYRDAAERPEMADAVLCGPVAYLPPAPAGGYPLDHLDRLADPHPARPSPPPGEIVVDEQGHDLFWSLSFAVRPGLWDRLGGFDDAYVGYGAEDTDFGRRAAAKDVPLVWVGGARAFHQHHPVSNPPVEHLDDIVRNADIFRARWGALPMRGWIDEFVAQGLLRPTDAGGYERADLSRPA